MYGFLGGPGGGPEAWDFSVASAFRLGPAAPDPAAFAGVFSSVETRKRAFLDTASQCSHAGITFCPLVIEAVGGGWLEALRSVVSWIASESNRNSSISHSDTSFQDRAAHLMRPSQGKRARDLETGSRTDRASMQLPESFSIVRVCSLTSSSLPNFVPGSVSGSVRVCFLCFCVCL